MTKNIYQFSCNDTKGNEVSLSDYRGKVLLIVNTASQCGFTPQYEGLEKLQNTYPEESFCVLAFPCNQFGGQEPGSNEEIVEFCKLNYRNTFPVFSKIEVKGNDAHPLFAFLTNLVDKFMYILCVRLYTSVSKMCGELSLNRHVTYFLNLVP